MTTRTRGPDKELIRSVWEEARDLVKRLEGTTVQKFKVEAGEYKIEIERGAPAPVAAPAAPGAPAAPAAPMPAAADDGAPPRPTSGTRSSRRSSARSTAPRSRARRRSSRRATSSTGPDGRRSSRR